MLRKAPGLEGRAAARGRRAEDAAKAAACLSSPLFQIDGCSLGWW